MNSILSSVRGFTRSIPGWAWGFIAGALTVLFIAILMDRAEDARFEEDVRFANARAEYFEIQYDSATLAYEERARQLIDSREAMRDSLGERNAKLARALDEAGATITHLQETTTTLRAKLDSSATTVETVPDDSTRFVVTLDERVAFDGGGFVHVQGPVRIEITEPSVDTDLAVSGEFPLSVVISRTESGELRVDAFTGDPRLAVGAIDVTANVERPASSLDLGGIAGQFTRASPWINRGLGALSCIAAYEILF